MMSKERAAEFTIKTLRYPYSARAYYYENQERIDAEIKRERQEGAGPKGADI
jgi:hypothetical protein